MKNDNALIIAAVARVVRLSTRHAWVVIAAFFIAAIVAGVYVSRHIAINTDSSKLLSSSLPWRQQEERLNQLFPQRTDLITAVIDATTPEAADEAADALAKALIDQKDVVRAVTRPDGGEFFARNGILFLGVDDVRRNMDELIKAEPFLGTLALDPTLRGILGAISQSLEGVRLKKTTLEDIEPAVSAIADALEGVEQGRRPAFSWRRLISGRAPERSDLRRFVNIQAVLNYGDLQPGGEATKAVRATIAKLGLTPERGVTVRLTGSVPLSDEEFSTIADGAALNGMVTIVVVLLILWLALRRVRIVLAVLINLAVGLSFSAAVGLAMVGALNLISVAFAVLFIGLGVDFGIQFSVRYRAERFADRDLLEALETTGLGVAGPLLLAAASIAAAFYSFLPTAYVGLSELGLIAGFGMLIAFLTSTTLLPALLSQLKPRSEPRQLGYSFLAPVDEFLERHRTPILILTALAILAASPLLFWLRFDFNPMNLRNRDVESVATYLQLEKEGAGGSNNIEALEPTLAQADAMAARLRTLPQVSRVVTLSTFIPDQQREKLPLIQNAAATLNKSLYPSKMDPPPTDADNVAAINSTVEILDKLAEDAPPGPGVDAAKRLSADLTTLANADVSGRQRAATAFVQPLQTVLGELRSLLHAKEVTRETLPADLVKQWTTPDGQARLEVSPSGNANDNTTLRLFAHEVVNVEPNATEGPISILEARKTILAAFLEAGAFALLSIAVLLWITLRRLGDVLLTLIPLLVAGVVTLEICVAIDMPLNFANIIALPLLLGVGVAFKIYYIMAWREGQTRLLQSVLTRAVTFSACTTATAFGSLYFSSDPGTSSMGKLLAISLLTTMTAAALFQPILMGKPREEEALAHARRKSLGVTD